MKNQETNENKKQSEYNVTIYTDGACSGNPGKGGWGAILIYKKNIPQNKQIEKKDKSFFNKDNVNENGVHDICHLNDMVKKKISGNNSNTTNNIMELTAVIEALKILKKPCNIELFSDSKYVINGITLWLSQWQKNNWRCSGNKPVKNVELWKEFVKLSSEHKITCNWVKGHADDKLNNEVDLMAREEIKKTCSV